MDSISDAFVATIECEDLYLSDWTNVPEDSNFCSNWLVQLFYKDAEKRSDSEYNEAFSLLEERICFKIDASERIFTKPSDSCVVSNAGTQVQQPINQILLLFVITYFGIFRIFC